MQKNEDLDAKLVMYKYSVNFRFTKVPTYIFVEYIIFTIWYFFFRFNNLVSMQIEIKGII